MLRRVSSGVLTSLLHSPSAGTQAAAASTLTKLAIKAKAMTADSKEVGQVMNTVLAVLKGMYVCMLDAKEFQNFSVGFISVL